MVTSTSGVLGTSINTTYSYPTGMVAMDNEFIACGKNESYGKNGP